MIGGIKKLLVVAAGWLAFVLGTIGIFVPGLPTTIFWILAALAFMHTNRGMYERIVGHPRFGPGIKLFVEEGRISLHGKLVAITAMALSGLLSVWFIPLLWLKLLLSGIILAGALWVGSRPLSKKGLSKQGEGDPP